MTNPFITIVVPTRDRSETLGATLKTCISQDYDALEVIVSDNASQDRTYDVAHSLNDPRIRYINPGHRVSMSGNFEFALGHVKPGYVISIGDDDGLMPGALQLASDVLRQTGLRAIASSSVYYVWPNFPAEHMRNLMLIRDTRKGLSILSGKQEAAKRASFRADTHRYVWGLPTIYRGIVSTEVINLGRRDGRYFHSVTPDAYSGFVNCFHLDHYAFLRQPLTIEGVSGRSNGAAQLIAKDRSEEERYLRENDIAFSSELVYTPAAPVILAEAFLQARNQFPEAASHIDFDIGRVCRQALREAGRGPNSERVKCAVREICRHHGIERPPRMNASDFILELIHRMSGTLIMCELNCTPFGVLDVHDASVIANRALNDREFRGGATGLRLLTQKVGRVLKRSVHSVRAGQ